MLQIGAGVAPMGMVFRLRTITLRIDYAVKQNISVGAHINYTWIPSRALRHEQWMTYGHDYRNQIPWCGVGLTVSF